MDIRLPSGRVTTIPKDELSDVSKMKLVGSGSFGQVYSYKNDETGLHIAIKRIPLMTKQFSKLVEQVKKEISIHTKLTHENIVRYYGCYKSDDCICVALELMEMSLKHKLNLLEDSVGIRENEPLLPSVAIMRYLCALLSGLVFLHHQKIIHRDLRSPNILLKSNDVLKIADFGISKELDLLSTQAGFDTVQVGNMFWCAPEMADDDPTADSVCDDRVDVWSLGVVVLEMVHNIPPFMRSSPMRYMKQLSMMRGPDIPTFLSEDIKEVLAMCFTFDAAKRPRSKDIMETVQTVYDPVQYDIFCSHNWGHNATNHDKVKIINEELTKSGFRTWFDSDPGRMEGNVHSAMSRGIESSMMALVFVTKEYQDKVNGKGARGSNDNCYLEFHHIVRKLTVEKTLAVVMDADMTDDSKWTEVLGITMAGRIFVDMSGNLEEKNYLPKKFIELRKNVTSILNDKAQSGSISFHDNLKSIVTGMREAELEVSKITQKSLNVNDRVAESNRKYKNKKPDLEDDGENVRDIDVRKPKFEQKGGFKFGLKMPKLHPPSYVAQVGVDAGISSPDVKASSKVYVDAEDDESSNLDMPTPGSNQKESFKFGMNMPKLHPPSYVEKVGVDAGISSPDVKASSKVYVDAEDDESSNLDMPTPGSNQKESFKFGMNMPKLHPPSYVEKVGVDAGISLPDVKASSKVYVDAEDDGSSNLDMPTPGSNQKGSFKFGMSMPKLHPPSYVEKVGNDAGISSPDVKASSKVYVDAEDDGNSNLDMPTLGPNPKGGFKFGMKMPKLHPPSHVEKVGVEVGFSPLDVDASPKVSLDAEVDEGCNIDLRKAGSGPKGGFKFGIKPKEGPP